MTVLVAAILLYEKSRSKKTSSAGILGSLEQIVQLCALCSSFILRMCVIFRKWGQRPSQHIVSVGTTSDFLDFLDFFWFSTSIFLCLTQDTGWKWCIWVQLFSETEKNVKTGVIHKIHVSFTRHISGSTGKRFRMSTHIIASTINQASAITSTINTAFYTEDCQWRLLCPPGWITSSLTERLP